MTKPSESFSCYFINNSFLVCHLQQVGIGDGIWPKYIIRYIDIATLSEAVMMDT